LVPHVLHGPYYHVEDDYGVCKRLQQAYPFCIMAPFFYTPVEAKSFISGLDLLVGSGCIAVSRIFFRCSHLSIGLQSEIQRFV
jgi:hypothetical protein